MNTEIAAMHLVGNQRGKQGPSTACHQLQVNGQVQYMYYNVERK